MELLPDEQSNVKKKISILPKLQQSSLNQEISGVTKSDRKKEIKVYRSIKQNLKKIIKDKNHQTILNDVVIMVHRITIHTYQFLKLYLLHAYEYNTVLPVLNEDLISNIMIILCERSNPTYKKVGRKPKQETQDLKNLLLDFYDKHYKDLITDNIVLSIINMNQILEYITTDILTAYTNNIKMRYITYLERFINVLKGKKVIQDSSLSKEEKKAKIDYLQKLKQEIIKCQTITDTDLLPHLNAIRPNRPITKSLAYDVKCTPLDYLPCMIYMMKFVESKEFKIYNVFPLRNECVPGNIRLDTAILIYLFYDNDCRITFNRTKSELLNNIKKYKDEIWKYFFRTDLKCFNNSKSNKYKFAHSIVTDGVSCSILHYYKTIKYPTTITEEITEEYIDELSNYEDLQHKKIVGIDPNKGDLIYCSTKIYENPITEKQCKQFMKHGYYVDTFRYTQNQRRYEKDTKKHTKKMNNIKTTQIQDIETVLSNYNRKTLILDEFKKYLKEKNKSNDILLNHYQELLFRKFRFYKFINTQRSEQKMLNNFKKKFGNPDTVIIGFGDWEQKSQMKYHEPTKGKGFRKLFRKAGYQVYLVDEYRTSCRCHNCQSEEGINEKFRKCRNPRPWMCKRKNIEKHDYLRHGLLKCKTCKGLWNRDLNSSLNIYRIVECAIQHKQRPTYLCRGKQINTTTSVPVKVICKKLQVGVPLATMVIQK